MESEGLNMNTVSSKSKKQSLEEITALCFSFLIFNTGIIVQPPRGLMRIEWVYACKCLESCLALSKPSINVSY